MSSEDVVVTEGREVSISGEVFEVGSGLWFALVRLGHKSPWNGLYRSTRASAERDLDLMLSALRQMGDGYEAPAPAPQPQPPMVVTHTIANVGGIARDRWTCGERYAEARWDADARMWRADVWGAGGHECTYWAPSSEAAAAAAAVMLGEVAS